VLQAAAAGLGYTRALIGLIKTATKGKQGSGFLAADAGATFSGLTLEKFLEACLTENALQMATVDMRLLQPRALPSLASFVLEALDIWRRAGDSARTHFAR
jgi:hypothetical protein